MVVDLDGGPTTYGGVTLAELASGGLRGEHLRPGREGVAVVDRGSLEPDRIAEVVGPLIERWPAVVLRGSSPSELLGRVPHVTVIPDIPGLDLVGVGGALIRQQLTGRRWEWGRSLPPPGRHRVGRMLDGVVDPRWRWVRAWRAVWDRRWT